MKELVQQEEKSSFSGRVSVDETAETKDKSKQNTPQRGYIKRKLPNAFEKRKTKIPKYTEAFSSQLPSTKKDSPLVDIRASCKKHAPGVGFSALGPDLCELCKHLQCSYCSFMGPGPGEFWYCCNCNDGPKSPRSSALRSSSSRRSLV